MNVQLLEELGRQLAQLHVEFEARHGCKPTVAIVNSALMRELVGDVQNCVVFLAGLVVLADPTAEHIALTALEIPDSLRPTPARPVSPAQVLH